MDLPPEAGKALPGALGAASAAILAILQDPKRWATAVALVPPGVAGSWYGGPYVAHLVGMPEGLAGYMTGLFAMAAAGKLLVTLHRFDLGGPLSRLLNKLLGVETKP